MKKHLVLGGGGHAHMVALANLNTLVEKGHSVSVVGPSEYHYYSGMGPGMLGKTYTPEDIRFATRHVVEKQGGAFYLDEIVRVLPREKTVRLKSGVILKYDVLSLNIGSGVDNDFSMDDPMDVFTVKPIEKLMTLQKRLIQVLDSSPKKIGIIGGGPSTVEVAGNIWQLARHDRLFMPDMTILSGKRFMNRFRTRVRSKIKRYLEKRKIKIHENRRVSSISNRSVITDSGERYQFDLVVVATGVRPSAVIRNSGLPCGPDGGLRVNRFLQCPEYPEIFGGGDCMYFEPQPLDKVGVYAVRQNPVLFHNLMAALEGEGLVPFDPGGDYLLVFNMGGGIGVLEKRGITLGGRTAFIIKDYIDRKFMKRYQALE